MPRRRGSHAGAYGNLGARLAAGAVATAMLLAPALWNGFPLLQYDTGGYLARWYEASLTQSRPGAYGLLLAASGPFWFWPLLLAQALLTVWMVALTLRVHGLGRRPFLMLGLVALLSVATSLSWLVSILLTDIFAGLSVLALYLLVMQGEALTPWEKPALAVLVAFAAATHSATLAMLVALALASAAALLLRRGLVSRRGVARALAAAGLGIALTFAANFAVSGRLAWTPGGPALLFGRMLQDGIVARYLDDHCPNARLRLCDFQDELPRYADTWFWGNELFDALGRFDGLDAEMEAIVLGSLRDYPWMQAKTAAAAAARQLVFVASGEGVVNSIWHTYAIITRYTPWAVPAMRAARQQTQGIDFTLINFLHVPAALAAMLLLPAIMVLGWRRPRFAGLGTLAASVLLALLANAAVCGIFSNPHDRYGARVAWLAVLVVGMAAAQWLNREKSRAPRPTPHRTSSRIA